MCSECARERIKVRFPGKIVYSSCPNCGAIKVKKRWEHNDVDSILLQAGTSLVRADDPSFIISGKSLSRIDEQRGILEVSVKVSENFTFDVRHEVFLRKNSESCDSCNRKTGSYYEAILQVRFTFPDRFQQRFRILDGLMSMVSKESRNEFVSKVAEVQGGIDLYLGSKKLADRMLRSLNATYPGTMKITKKISGRDDGRNTYRYTHLFRVINPSRGSVFQIGNEICVFKCAAGRKLIFVRGIGKQDISMDPNALERAGYRMLAENAEKVRLNVKAEGEHGSLLINSKSGDRISFDGHLPSGEMEFTKYKGKLYPLGRCTK